MLLAVLLCNRIQANTWITDTQSQVCTTSINLARIVCILTFMFKLGVMREYPGVMYIYFSNHAFGLEHDGNRLTSYENSNAFDWDTHVTIILGCLSRTKRLNTLRDTKKHAQEILNGTVGSS